MCDTPFQFLSFKPVKNGVFYGNIPYTNSPSKSKSTVSKLSLYLTSVSSNSTPGMFRGSISCNSGLSTCKYHGDHSNITLNDHNLIETQSYVQMCTYSSSDIKIIMKGREPEWSPKIKYGKLRKQCKNEENTGRVSVKSEIYEILQKIVSFHNAF